MSRCQSCMCLIWVRGGTWGCTQKYSKPGSSSCSNCKWLWSHNEWMNPLYISPEKDSIMNHVRHQIFIMKSYWAGCWTASTDSPTHPACVSYIRMRGMWRAQVLRFPSAVANYELISGSASATLGARHAELFNSADAFWTRLSSGPI